jgi:hypothetical protein
MGFELLHPKTDRDKWMKVIQMLPQALRDVHWTPDYMAAEELRGHAPRLAIFTYHEYVVAQPIVIRDIFPHEVVWDADETVTDLAWWNCRDVSSPYGYGGPASNHGQPQQLYAWFNQGFTAWARENRVVSEFCALHPFMLSHQLWMLKAVPQISPAVRKQIVWIDLKGDFRPDYHANRHEGIKRAVKEGVKVRMGGKVDEFIRLYLLTMYRKQASARWYFPEEYLRALCDFGLVFYAYVGDVLASAALMLMMRDGTAYYHLAANADAYPKSGANDLLVNDMAEFAARQGCNRFHLGGGATSTPTDSVLFFKGGFSDLRAPAMSYFRVFDEAAYAALCAEKKRREVAETGIEFNTSFEPFYRREAS